MSFNSKVVSDKGATSEGGSKKEYYKNLASSRSLFGKGKRPLFTKSMN
jgi:hypothetical protein